MSYKKAKERIEDALIPGLLLMVVRCYISQAHDEGEFGKTRKILQDYIKEVLGSNKKLYRRLDRSCLSVYNYFYDQKFDTRKCFLALSAWAKALIEANAIEVDKSSSFYGILADLDKVAATGYDSIKNFDKIEFSALKHVPALHKLAEKQGYFV